MSAANKVQPVVDDKTRNSSLQKKQLVSSRLPPSPVQISVPDDEDKDDLSGPPLSFTLKRESSQRVSKYEEVLSISNRFSLSFKEEAIEEEYQDSFVFDYENYTRHAIWIGYVVAAAISAFNIGVNVDSSWKTNVALGYIAFWVWGFCAVAISFVNKSLFKRFLQYYAAFMIFFLYVGILVGAIASCLVQRLTLVDAQMTAGDTTSAVCLLLAVLPTIFNVRFTLCLLLSWLMVISFFIAGMIGSLYYTFSNFAQVCLLLAGINACFNVAAYKNELQIRKEFWHERKLKMENQKLAAELEELVQVSQEAVDLDSPITKAVSLLKLLGDNSSTVSPDDVKRMARQATVLLSAGNLYAPDLKNELNRLAVDQNIQQYLNQHLMIGQGDQNTFPAAQGALVNTNSSKLVKLGSSEELDAFSFLGTMTHLQRQQLDTLLTTVDDWNFDVFKLAQLTGGHPLSFLVMHLVQRYKLLNQVEGVSESKLKRFLSAIEAGYHVENPYHNATHASDVVQTAHAILINSGFMDAISPLELLAFIVSCAMHDHDHPGLTNNYLILTESPLAIFYNDKSVLESHHAASGFGIMLKPDMNFLASAPKKTFKDLRSMIVDIILATDLSGHFDILGLFNTKTNTQSWKIREDQKDKLLFLKVCIKMADINNVAKKPELYHQWVENIMGEFYMQGDRERSADIAISAFMDRDKPNIAQCQAGFIDFLVKPLFEAWKNFQAGSPFAAFGKGILDQLEANRNRWTKRPSIVKV
eukprot:gnl/Hemi2/510_TR181_c0_g7_i1.p1 gnl/Hemi2/510_TR181_c0_g7~~gnl/Hemi2/510_TR181_c0_g7_i1.p1  ORF type:complete len:755 (-),score=290.59 gnl/Hemi2/510_TR181_c0_g7_i1:323-2587(-)